MSRDERINGPQRAKHNTRNVCLVLGVGCLVGVVAAAAEPDALRQKQQAQERARALAGELINVVLDVQLRQLEALLLVADQSQTFLISGQGDVIEPDSGIAAIGSGGSFATSAATALMEHTQLPARQIAEEAMKIAGKICIYTNDKVTIEEL